MEFWEWNLDRALYYGGFNLIVSFHFQYSTSDPIIFSYNNILVKFLMCVKLVLFFVQFRIHPLHFLTCDGIYLDLHSICHSPHSLCSTIDTWLAIHGPLQSLNNVCRNPSLGLTTKARGCKGVGQEWSPGITFHAPKNVGKCEGMNPHTPKWTLALGVVVLMDSQIFKGRLQGSKLIALKISLYHWKDLKT